MNNSRRGFLKGAGIILAAPAIVRAESLMKIFVPEKKVLYGVAALDPAGLIPLSCLPELDEDFFSRWAVNGHSYPEVEVLSTFDLEKTFPNLKKMLEFRQ